MDHPAQITKEVRDGSTIATVRGFTLIETIITIVIVAIAATAVMIPFMTSLGGSPKASHTQQAIELAQGELDQLIADKRASGFGAIALGPAACTLPMLPGFGPCTRTVCYVLAGTLNNTSPCETVIVTNFKHATITIASATAGTITAVTLLTNY
jgi:prepilin-type N-terminal cleavage/methylation domain-containing protein